MAHEPMSIPMKVTPAQINAQNRESWGQNVGDCLPGGGS
jgi:hypothetical protein